MKHLPLPSLVVGSSTCCQKDADDSGLVRQVAALRHLESEVAAAEGGPVGRDLIAGAQETSRQELLDFGLRKPLIDPRPLRGDRLS